MDGIINVFNKDNTGVIALVMFYENITTNKMKVFRVLSCVLYTVIENYVYIEYLYCQSKNLSVICSDKIFENRSYNESIVIVIYISINAYYIMPWIHEEKNSTVIILCCTWLVEYYLEKGFVILKHNSNNLSSVHNEAKQGIHVINMHKSDLVMDIYTEITSVANTIK